MPGRAFTSSSYRYGFNGKENDPESGTQDYGMRIYDPRTGRFLSTDPLFKSFAYKTPYDFAENTPIMSIDLDGGESEFYALAKMGFFGSTAQQVTNDLDKGAVKSVKKFAHGMVQTGKLVQCHGTDKEYVDAAVGIFAQMLYVQTPGGHKIVADYLSKSKNGTLNAVGQNMKALDKEAGDVNKAFKEGNAEKIGEVVTDMGILVVTAVASDFVMAYALPSDAVLAAEVSQPLSKEIWHSERMTDAISARDFLIDELYNTAKTKNQLNDYTVVVGGYNIETGEIAVAAKSSKINGPSICGEDMVVQALGGNATKVKMTPAIRPRSMMERTVCTRCEQRFGREAFADDVRFASDDLNK